MKEGRKHFKKIGAIGFTLFFLPFVFWGCSPKVSWISAEPKSIELSSMGETFQVKAMPLDKENKPVPNAVLNWVSSHPDVAEVSDTGMLTAKGSGNTVISVTSPGTDAKAVVQCKASILSAIKVAPEQAELKVGEKRQVEAKVLNEKGELFEDQMVGWASSNDAIVFIDDLGEITAVAPGEATLTATTPSKGLSHVYGRAKITVKP